MVGTRPIWDATGLTGGIIYVFDGEMGAKWDGEDAEEGGEGYPVESVEGAYGAGETVTFTKLRSLGGGCGIGSSGCALRSSSANVLKSP